MAPTAAWRAEAFGLDEVRSRGRESEFDSLVSLSLGRNRLAEEGKGTQRCTAILGRNCALGQAMTRFRFTSPAPLDNPGALMCIVRNCHLSSHEAGARDERSSELSAGSISQLHQNTGDSRCRVQSEALRHSHNWATTRGALGRWGILLALPRRASFLGTACLHSVLVSQVHSEINENAVLKGETQHSMPGCFRVSYTGVHFASLQACRESHPLE